MFKRLLAAVLAMTAAAAFAAVDVNKATAADLDIVTDFNLEFAPFVLELAGRDDGFGLEAGADSYRLGGNFDHAAHQDGAGLDPCVGETLLEEKGEIFRHVCRFTARRRTCVLQAPAQRAGRRLNQTPDSLPQ